MVVLPQLAPVDSPVLEPIVTPDGVNDALRIIKNARQMEIKALADWMLGSLVLRDWDNDRTMLLS